MSDVKDRDRDKKDEPELTRWQQDVLLDGSDGSAQFRGVLKPDYSQPPRDDGTEYRIRRAADLTGHLGTPVEPVADEQAVAENDLPEDSYVGQELNPDELKKLVQPKEANKDKFVDSKLDVPVASKPEAPATGSGVKTPTPSSTTTTK